MSDPFNDPNYPPQWDPDYQRWFRQKYNHYTKQWEFMDWLPEGWPPPAGFAPAPIPTPVPHHAHQAPRPASLPHHGHHRRDSMHPRPPNGQGNLVQGTYDRSNPVPETHYEKLDPAFYVRDSSFFQVGKLFAILFTEPAGANAVINAVNRITDYNTSLSVVRYQEYVHTQVRRFLVVKSRREFCFAVPIFTYQGKGTKKSGVAPDEHAIAFSYGCEATPLPGEQPLTKEPICIVMNEREKPLSEASRIYFGIHHPIQYNVKVKDLGYIHPDHVAKFHGYWAMELAKDTRQAAEVTAEASDALLDDDLNE